MSAEPPIHSSLISTIERASRDIDGTSYVTTEKATSIIRQHAAAPIVVLSDTEMQEINDRWDTATPLEKLAWLNGMATRPNPPLSHWREMLELANHFAKGVAELRDSADTSPGQATRNDAFSEATADSFVDRLNALQTYKIFHDIGEILVRREDVLTALGDVNGTLGLVRGQLATLARLAAYQQAFNAVDDLMEYRGMSKEQFAEIAKTLTEQLKGCSVIREAEKITGGKPCTVEGYPAEGTFADDYLTRGDASHRKDEANAAVSVFSASIGGATPSPTTDMSMASTYDKANVDETAEITHNKDEEPNYTGLQNKIANIIYTYTAGNDLPALELAQRAMTKVWAAVLPHLQQRRYSENGDFVSPCNSDGSLKRERRSEISDVGYQIGADVHTAFCILHEYIPKDVPANRDDLQVAAMAIAAAFLKPVMSDDAKRLKTAIGGLRSIAYGDAQTWPNCSSREVAKQALSDCGGEKYVD